MERCVGSSSAVVRLSLASLCFAVAGISGCSSSPKPPEPDLTTVEVELNQLREGHRAAIDARDVDRVLEFYAPDLITVSPEMGIVRGRDWVRSTCEQLFRDYDFHEDFTPGDIRIMGDRVAATFTFEQRMTPLAGGEPIVVTGKGVGIFKRSATGGWQFEFNSYGVDPAAPAAAAAASAKAPG